MEKLGRVVKIRVFDVNLMLTSLFFINAYYSDMS